MTNKKHLSIILRYKLENIMREDVYLFFLFKVTLKITEFFVAIPITY